MKRWTQLERALTPDGSVMTLMHHDGHYAIQVDGRELMSTRHFASEERLGELACLPFQNAHSPKILIGGLGLGFTLRAALGVLPASATVVVAELMSEVVEWNQNANYPLANQCLKDPRTRVEVGDVWQLIAKAKATFDAIVLDADNGTTAMNSAGNQKLYEDVGLAQVRAALKSGGVVVYWSAQAEPIFAKRMAKSGFAVETHRVRSHPSGGGLHTLLVGR